MIACKEAGHTSPCSVYMWVGKAGGQGGVVIRLFLQAHLSFSCHCLNFASSPPAANKQLNFSLTR